MVTATAPCLGLASGAATAAVVAVLVAMSVAVVVAAAAAFDFSDFDQAPASQFGQRLFDGQRIAIEHLDAPAAQTIEHAASDSASADDGIDVLRRDTARPGTRVDAKIFPGNAVDDQQPGRRTEVGGNLGLQAEIVIGWQTDFHGAYRSSTVISICHDCRAIPDFCQETRPIHSGTQIACRPTALSVLSCYLAPSIGISGPIPRRTVFEDTGGPFFLDTEQNHPDLIGDELTMRFETGNGLLVLAGCCHNGLINTVTHIRRISRIERIHAIIGGLHLLNATADRTEQTLRFIADCAPDFLIPCHCTGPHIVEQLQRPPARNDPWPKAAESLLSFGCPPTFLVLRPLELSQKCQIGRHFCNFSRVRRARQCYENQMTTQENWPTADWCAIVS